MISFATGAGLRTLHWKQEEPLDWTGFVAWLGLENPADHKECGGYVAGLLQETTGHQGKPKCVGLHRNARAVVARSVLALDADTASGSFVADVGLELAGLTAVLHTTWRHTEEKPRWRMLLPLSRDVSPAEYRLLVGALMTELGIDQFDRGSREPERFMHRPSTQGAYRAYVLEGKPLDVDKWLGRAEKLGLALVEKAWERYVDDSEQRAEEDGIHPVAQEELEEQFRLLRTLPQPWYTGAGWDSGVFRVACNLVELANSGWSGYSMEQAEKDLLEWAPTDDVWSDKENLEKLRSAQSRVAGGGRQPPDETTPAQDFAAARKVTWPEVPSSFSDAYLCAWMANKGLDRDWVWAAGLGWLLWDGRRWAGKAEEDACEAVRRVVLRLNRAALGGGDPGLSKSLYGLLSKARIKAVVTLMRGVVSIQAGLFDQERDLLNVGNGVVDLRTGELLAHDKGLLLMKITPVDYVPGAAHEDWSLTLECLEPAVADWMQVRFGQAASGWPTSDDVMPIGQGSGSNGKSTLIGALFRALGEHMTLVPEKLLRASAGDHPTELMSLFGVRVAVIEETPEVAFLNVQRLKAVLGTVRMTARGVFKDNVSWSPTHSLFVLSNYTPQVRETDHGTWRRLALVRFDRRFPKRDSFRTLMERGDDGRAEAALAWVVAGAKRWYDADRMLPGAPAKVERDTAEWRGESDLVQAFARENLVLERGPCILAVELLDEFNAWLQALGHKPWSASTFVSRFKGHEMSRGVYQEQPRVIGERSTRDPLRPVSARAQVWRNVRWICEVELGDG